MTSSAADPSAEGVPAHDLDRPRPIDDTVSADAFKQLFRGHPGGVALVTAVGPDGPVALTATSVASVSVDPPVLIFSIADASSAAPTIAAADTIVVHLLDADDLELARLGATSGIDRFADTSRWTPLVTGEPVFSGARAWIRAGIAHRLRAGTSTVIAAQALQVEESRGPGQDARPLVYHDRTWHELGDGSRL